MTTKYQEPSRTPSPAGLTATRGCGCFCPLCWRRNRPGVSADVARGPPATGPAPDRSGHGSFQRRGETCLHQGPGPVFPSASRGLCLGVGPGPRSHSAAFLAGASQKPQLGFHASASRGASLCPDRGREVSRPACWRTGGGGMLGVGGGCSTCQRDSQLPPGVV